MTCRPAVPLRVAALNAKRGEFSSAVALKCVRTAMRSAQPNAAPCINSHPHGDFEGRLVRGDRDVTSSIVAHLRGPDSFEIVAATTDGRIVALDATRGVALWTARSALRLPSALNTQVIAIRARGGDNILVLAGRLAILIEGRTGRELWRTTLPGTVGDCS